MFNYGDIFKRNYIRSSSEKFLYLTILPTEKCNFRCGYCYEDFAIGKMSPSVINGIKNLLDQSSSEIHNLVISWFGGEPTLNPKAIIEISEKIVELRKIHGFVYYSHMTTNGYLLTFELLEKLTALGVISYQISLDGDQIEHDASRRQANGKGSFARIWNNLISFKKSQLDFEIELRLHITNTNIQSMEKLLLKVDQEFSHDHRFKLIFEKIKNLGGGIESSHPEKFIDQDSDDRLENYLVRFNSKLTNGISDIRNNNPYICYASMPRQLMIRADGRIGKCTVMLDDEINDIGRINADGTLTINTKKFSIWTRGFDSLIVKELSCPAHKISNFQASRIPVIQLEDNR